MSRGARGLLASPAGEVGCELEALGVDESGARYELRISNGTTATLAATAYAVRAQDGRPVVALALEIPPQAQVRTGFSLDARLPYERVAAEVRGEGIHLVVEAAPPQAARPRRRWISPVAVFGCAAALAGTTLLVVAGQRPAVLAAALAASPGGDLVARWSTRGAGTPTYELRDAAGAVTARGALPGASGTVNLGRGDAATLHVAIANGFGSDARDAAYARATPPPAVRIVAPAPPHLASVSIEPSHDRAQLRVRYESERAGSVRLAILDRNGATWFATTLAAGRGEARIPAPPAGARQPYELLASVRERGVREETRVPVPVAPTAGAAPSAAPSAGAAADAPVAAAADPSAATGEVIVTPDVVVPGQTIAVQMPFAGGGRVAIVRDVDGSEVAGVDVAPGGRKTMIIVPTRDLGPYSVRVTVERGIGSVTMLHHLILAAPRRAGALPTHPQSYKNVQK